MLKHSFVPMLELTRGEIVESVHYGAVAVVETGGRLVASVGDPQIVTYLRSSAKPFQVMPFLAHGGQAAYGLSLAEIALMCASHSGTDEHLAAVQGLQAKTGVRESDLLCGVHPPYHPETAEAMRRRGEQPTPNRHNCSGKHTGMVAYTRLLGLYDDPQAASLTYINPAHPIQQDILHAFAAMCDLPAEAVPIGIDGCSAPNFAAPLYNAALGFARLVDPSGLDDRQAELCRTITSAMTTYPNMVGGPDSFDTHLMLAAQGRILVKQGAEGFLAIGVLPGVIAPGSRGLGIAIKIADGDLGAHSRAPGEGGGHARPAVAIEILRQLAAIGPHELSALASFGPTFDLHNWRSLHVGQARPCFTLEFAR